MKRSLARIEKHRCPGRATALTLCLALLVAPAGRLQANSSSEEYSVKAAFLFHFAQFVDWPPETFKDAGSALTYCTVGEDVFHGGLEASLGGKTIGSHPLSVKHFKQAREIEGCQILFFGAAEKKSIPEALSILKGNAVLTVGESEHFVQVGGVIGFLLEDNKVRFEINLDAAEKAKLKISSRLLTLAKTVIGGTKGN